MRIGIVGIRLSRVISRNWPCLGALIPAVVLTLMGAPSLDEIWILSMMVVIVMIVASELIRGVAMIKERRKKAQNIRDWRRYGEGMEDDNER